MGRACNAPQSGHYVQANGNEATCRDIPNKLAWVTGPASTDTGCDFTCNNGFEKHGRSCRFPLEGKYAQGGIAKPCIDIDHSVWSANTGAVTSDTGCAFECNTGFVKDTSDKECDLPSGHFIASDSTAKTCGTPPASSTGWLADQSSVNRKQDCVFSCATGRKAQGTGSGGTCPLKQNYFLSAGGADNRAATSCGSTPPASGTGWATTQASTVTSTASCVFTCPTGRTASGTTGPSGSCSLKAGHFPASNSVDSAGISCGTLPADSSGWVADQSGATSRSECVFNCATGFVKEGRICRRPREVLALVAGEDHTCAILEGGAVKCWGVNGAGGVLGLGDNDHRGDAAREMGNDLPKVNLNDADGTTHTAQSLTAGGWHTCAILDNNSVKCWGSNYYGQLGLGSGKTDNSYNTPQAVNLGTNSLTNTPNTAQSLTAEGEHTCVILDDDGNATNSGPVKCWGKNSDGQLGLGHETPQSTPQVQNTPQAVNLGTDRTAKSLAGGMYHTCAILDDNSVKCWGKNSDGQLGLGHETSQSTPQKVNLGTNSLTNTLNTAQSLVGGGYHICAILDDNSVKCWGNNRYGQLGRGDKTNQNTPQAVDLGTQRTARKLFLGHNSTCVVLDNDELKCWGGNGGGKLGQGNGTALYKIEGEVFSAPPKNDFGDEAGETVSGLSAIKLGTNETTSKAYTALSLAIGKYHICALLDNYRVKCWGGNHYGHLGQGNKTTFGSDASFCHNREGPPTCSVENNHNLGDEPNEMGDNLPFVILNPQN